ncbi:MAG TPA: carboxypeptidase-like regulatory domain-containing protein, partial [Polyangiaceae bacterium]|nr:carboxypeptidase-like regulatory domain-containing protein [Polyangiaceae bacterium]
MMALRGLLTVVQVVVGWHSMAVPRALIAWGCVLGGLAWSAPAAAILIEGKVIDQQGDPVADVEVTFSQSNTFVAGDTTDAAGNYQVDVGVGTYDVEVTPPVGSIFVPQSL